MDHSSPLALKTESKINQSLVSSEALQPKMITNNILYFISCTICSRVNFKTKIKPLWWLPSWAQPPGRNHRYHRSPRVVFNSVCQIHMYVFCMYITAIIIITLLGTGPGPDKSPLRVVANLNCWVSTTHKRRFARIFHLCCFMHCQTTQAATTVWNCNMS